MTKTILYISGWGRSGSTILGNILNEADSTFHVGELKHVWHSGFVRDFPCGCGKLFSSCPVWKAIRRRMVEKNELELNPAYLSNIQQHVLPTNRDAFFNRASDPHHPSTSFYLECIHALYQAVFDTTGCRLIIDSSKSPSYGFFLATYFSFDVRFVHLVRDPRASAFSWQRSVQRMDVRNAETIMQEKISPWTSTQRWLVCNTTMEILGRRFPQRYLRVHYEDLVAHPRRTAYSILEFAGNPNGLLPFQNADTVVLRDNHTVWGNPKRVKTGPIQIREDREWTYAMSSTNRFAVTALTWPWLIYYNYPPNGYSKRQQKIHSSLPHE